MRLRDIKELHTKTDEEIVKHLRDLKAELGKHKIDKALGKIKNVAHARGLKKDIARVLTIGRIRQFAEQAKAVVTKDVEVVKKVVEKKTAKKTKVKKEE